MIFHYFGTKKALYLYLINLCGDIMMNEVNEKFDNTVTDLFDRIKMLFLSRLKWNNRNRGDKKLCPNIE